MSDAELKAEILDDRTTPLGSAAGAGRTASRPARLWRSLPIAVVGVLAAGLVVLGRGPNGFFGPVAPPSPASLAAIAPTPAIAVGPSATADSSACGTGRVEVEPVSNPTEPQSIGPIRMPSGGLLAMAVETSDTAGSIVVAQTGENGLAGSVREVATFHGRDLQGPFGVTVVGWSSAADTFLVQARYESRVSDEPACANLFMVQADGSGVSKLTANGPDTWISASALAPRTRQTALVQGNELLVLDDGAVSRTVKLADCPLVWSLQWSPDERHLAAVCNGGQDLVLADPTQVRAVPIDADAVPVLAAWSPDSSSVTLVTAPRGGLKIGPLIVFDVDPATGIPARRLVSDTATEWAPSRFMSPNGQWLLIEGNLLGSTQFPSFVVDLTSGVTKRLEWPIFTGAVGQESFAWLPDGESMLYGDDGTLYVLNLRERTRTEVGLVPVPDFAWVNRAPFRGL